MGLVGAVVCGFESRFNRGADADGLLLGRAGACSFASVSARCAFSSAAVAGTVCVAPKYL